MCKILLNHDANVIFIISFIDNYRINSIYLDHSEAS